MANDAHLTLETGATPECLDEIHELIEQLARDGSLASDVVMRFDSAAMEIVANIVEHGTTAGPVHLEVELDVADGWARGVVTDDAPPVALTIIEMPEPLSERGRGLAIATLLLDEFGYSRTGEHNVWRLGVKVEGRALDVEKS